MSNNVLTEQKLNHPINISYLAIGINVILLA